jgi:hypothetical protein
MAFRSPPTRFQRGTVLVVAIVLLLIVSLATLLAMTVGVFEQRTTGSDLRAKMVHNITESAVGQGLEYLNANRALLPVPGANVAVGTWQLCDANDQTFPCGVAPDAHRATMYRFVGGEGNVGDFSRRFLPLGDSPVPPIGEGFEFEIGVGVLLCRVEALGTLDPDDPIPPAVCTTNPENATATSSITMVGLGSIPGEGSSATVVQNVGVARLIGNLPEAPSILASGSVNLTGTLDVVTNPNSAGTGVPVSVWTRMDVSKAGAPRTCYLEEWIRDGGTSDSPRYIDDTAVIRCDTCGCPTDGSLSYDFSGNTQSEGIDILDIDGDEGVNRDVRREEFPCDLFEYVFGVPAWEDRIPGTGPTDPEFNFCETALYTPDPVSGADIRVDQLFLRENARQIIANGDDCNTLGPNSSGLVWVQAAANPSTCVNGRTIGSAQAPVLLVLDGGVEIRGGTFFGLLFLRALEDRLSPTTGGSASLQINGNVTVYGSVVLQGSSATANGNAAVVYQTAIMQALLENPDFVNFTGIPGGWSDRFSY